MTIVLTHSGMFNSPVKTLYNYKVEIVSQDKIEQAILDQREDIIYFWVNIWPDVYFKHIYVVAAKEGIFLFYDTYNFHMIRNIDGKIGKRDLKYISEFLDKENK
jgi:hypothetical protein